MRDIFLGPEVVYLIDYLDSRLMTSNVKAPFGNIRHHGTRSAPCFNLPFPLTLILQI